MLLESFKDQIIVVTGASSGIGRAIALSFAEQGATCCLIARNKERLEAAAELIGLHSSLVKIYPYDLQIEENITEIQKQLKEKFGRVDVLVHSAGIYISSLLKNAAIEDFDKQYRANVRAPYLLTQSLLPMIRVAKGQIVFINSTQGLNASALLSQYASTQHAMKAIADSLREEVNPDGVRVLSMFLGRTATPRMHSIYEKEGRPYNPSLLLQPQDIASVVSHTLSLPRTAEVTNINIRPMIKSY
jgi:NADP-dependent 3-hydroxy acid dehydrogenase YdfG